MKKIVKVLIVGLLVFLPSLLYGVSATAVECISVEPVEVAPIAPHISEEAPTPTFEASSFSAHTSEDITEEVQPSKGQLSNQEQQQESKGQSRCQGQSRNTTTALLVAGQGQGQAQGSQQQQGIREGKTKKNTKSILNIILVIILIALVIFIIVLIFY